MKLSCPLSLGGMYHNFLRGFMRDLALIVFVLSLKSAYFNLIFFYLALLPVTMRALWTAPHSHI